MNVRRGPSFRRVAARFLAKRADLVPPLGYPGGVDHLINRIDREVRDPRLEHVLVDLVESGETLTNTQAGFVYKVETVDGTWKFKRLGLSIHAQYRMDLRGVTVPEVRLALSDFFRGYNEAKSRKQNPSAQAQARNWEMAMMRHEKIEWRDPRIGLTVVFLADVERGVLHLISTWWDQVG